MHGHIKLMEILTLLNALFGISDVCQHSRAVEHMFNEEQVKSQKTIRISQGSISMSGGGFLFTPREKIVNAKII